MADLFDPDDPGYLLGHKTMDETHKEFMLLANQLAKAGKETFADLFSQLVSHTKQHFASEQALMEETDFPALQEHFDEHQRILGDLTRLMLMIDRGSTAIARAFVREHLPEWFQLHASTMDSALAAHLRICEKKPATYRSNI